MGDFFSDLKSILGPQMLWEVVLGVRRNDLLGLAGQLAYFFLLFFFPFLIFLVSLTGLVIGNPEAGLKSLFEAVSGLVPATARTLVVDYVDRTLRTASTGALVLGIVGACGWARPRPSPSPRLPTAPTASRRAGRSGGCGEPACS
jgi:membrane protein